MNFKFSTKFMKKTPNNTPKTSIATVKNFIKAVTKIRTYKNSLLQKHRIYNSIKLYKDSDKIQKNKSLNK